VKTPKVALFTVFAAAAACGSSSKTPSGARLDADATVCPATPDEAISAACTVPGLQCGPQYTCGVTQVTLLCVCTNGVFQCTDGAGNLLIRGDTPACPGKTTAGSCPAAEADAQLMPCGEQGLLCAYPSRCSGRFDQCQCFPGMMPGGGYGLRFDCQVVTCGGALGESDSGADSSVPSQDSSVDSGPDSSLDSGRDSAPDADSGTDAPTGSDALAGDASRE
jgi:hypothetical protein